MGSVRPPVLSPTLSRSHIHLCPPVSFIVISAPLVFCCVFFLSRMSAASAPSRVVVHALSCPSSRLARGAHPLRRPTAGRAPQRACPCCCSSCHASCRVGVGAVPSQPSEHPHAPAPAPRTAGGSNVYYAWLRTVSATGVAPLARGTAPLTSPTLSSPHRQDASSGVYAPI